MKKIKKYFDKAGGWKLIKQWAKGGVLHIAIIQFLLLGTSKKSLELLRNVISLKYQNRLKKQYNSVLKRCDKIDFTKKEHKFNKNLWIFWWQGIEKAPILVRRCCESVKRNLSDWNIIVVTEHNYSDYVELPSFIIEKMEAGKISITHFSDILRLNLLIEYGGLWLDSTVLCTSGKIPKAIMEADLFVYQTQKPGADGHATLMSNWLIKSNSNNKLLIATRELLYEYWKRNNFVSDYFIFHQFFTIVCQRYPDEANLIPPYTNENPHLLLLHFFDKYDENIWNDWKHQSFFHKLSYKLDKKDMGKAGTFYDMIIKQNKI